MAAYLLTPVLRLTLRGGIGEAAVGCQMLTPHCTVAAKLLTGCPRGKPVPGSRFN